MLSKVKRLLKKSKTITQIYQDVNQHLSFTTDIAEITPLNGRDSKIKQKRLTIIVPSINEEHVFGGISTALKFYEELADKLGYARRIVTCDACPANRDVERYIGYTLVNSVDDLEAEKQIVAFNDRYNKTIPVWENDYFVFTGWWTAYVGQAILRWQSTNYHNDIKKSVYFIQDFEPGFYSWSSRYALAESTYRSGIPQIAIFNSSQLRDYFKNNGYQFSEEYFFEPRLNLKLKECLNQITQWNKKKQIIIYGRPSVQRNAFELIVGALKVWIWKQLDIQEWQVLSIGEQHQDVDLGNGITLKSLGKLSLERYAKIMEESYLGISLMVSPHPSYPPLEMATFGVKVITNRYANKDLSAFSENISNCEVLDIECIAIAVQKICNGFEQRILKADVDVSECYIDDARIFDFIDKIQLD